MNKDLIKLYIAVLLVNIIWIVFVIILLGDILIPRKIIN